MRKARCYEWRYTEGDPYHCMWAGAPKEVADQVFSCVAATEVWVKLESKGSKWVLYRLGNGVTKRAKSLRVQDANA